MTTTSEHSGNGGDGLGINAAPDPTAIADRYLAALNAEDPVERSALISQAWTEDGSLTDPPVAGEGHAGICQVADTLHSVYPGHTFARTSEVDAHHSRILFSWALLDPAGATVSVGADFAVVAPDGRVSDVTGFFGNLRLRS